MWEPDFYFIRRVGIDNFLWQVNDWTKEPVWRLFEATGKKIPLDSPNL
jgi:hypothetical protein